MSNVSDLPPIGGAFVIQCLLSGERCEGWCDPKVQHALVGAEPREVSGAVAAVLLVFPPSRDTRLVADLARVFVGLRERHGRRCRSLLLSKRFKPIAARLRRMGAAAAAIEREIAELEAAVARLVWRLDGCPSIVSGGGCAA